MTLTAERVAAAFDVVRREDFLPQDQRRYAGQDRPLVIGHGQTNSQPSTVRRMLELLNPQPGDRVLDVGSGSGWTAALIGTLVATTGRVYGVELEPDLVTFARANLTSYDMTWVSVDPAPAGVLGLPEHAPYQRILVSAQAREMPTGLVDQLAPSGRMVIPVAGRMYVVDRSQDGEVTTRREGHYAFVPLRTPREG